jgi:hypothetical protein
LRAKLREKSLQASTLEFLKVDKVNFWTSNIGKNYCSDRNIYREMAITWGDLMMLKLADSSLQGAITLNGIRVAEGVLAIFIKSISLNGSAEAC